MGSINEGGGPIFHSDLVRCQPATGWCKIGHTNIEGVAKASFADFFSQTKSHTLSKLHE